MTGTEEGLRRIRAFLDEDPPNTKKAVRMVKDLLIKGPCSLEVEGIRKTAIRILERLVRPALGGDHEKQIRVRRLVRDIQNTPSLNAAALAESLQQMAPWMASLKGGHAGFATPPPFPPQRLWAALTKLTTLSLQTGSSGAEDDPWLQPHALLGRLIKQEKEARAQWDREQETLRDSLTELVATLADAVGEIGGEGEGVATLARQLGKGKSITDLTSVCEVVLLELGMFGKRAQSLEKRLDKGRDAVKRFQELLRRADWALMETRDETLVDIFTGLPNRFALSARIDRAINATDTNDGQGSFALVLVLLDDYPGMVKDLGRTRLNHLMAALAARLTQEPRPGDYLTRFNDDTFVILCPQTDLSAAEELAVRVRDALDITQFEWEDALLTVQPGLSVIRHQAGMTEESLLGLAQIAAKKALTPGKNRIQVIQPRVPPPETE